MKVTRKEPVDNPVFIELTKAEAKLLVRFLGEITLLHILCVSRGKAHETDDFVYKLYATLADTLNDLGVR